MVHMTIIQNWTGRQWRGETCGHNRSFYTFLNGVFLVPKYGKIEHNEMDVLILQEPPGTARGAPEGMLGPHLGTT